MNQANAEEPPSDQSVDPIAHPEEHETSSSLQREQQHNHEKMQEMSTVFEQIVCPSIRSMEEQLHEIIQSQESLLAVVRQLGIDPANHEQLQEIEQTFRKVPSYIQKTQETRKMMRDTNDKIGSLKKRCEALSPSN